MKTLACIFFLVCAATAQADTLYKVVGPDGKITYTDRPAAEGKSVTALEFASAPSSPLPDSVLKYQADLQKSMQNRLAQASKIESSGTPTLFIATWCGYCTRAKAYLKGKGIGFREYDIDTAEGGRAYFEAGGRKGVPLLVAGDKRQQGFSEGSYDKFFAAKK
jgi:glutaredoxin